MSSTLEEVAAAADAVADEQRQVARDARRMQRQRDRGLSWAAVLDSETAPGVLGRLRRSLRRVGELTGSMAELLARGLSVEGESRRQIGRRLGVTHQRVSAILNSRAHGNGNSPAPCNGSSSDLADR